MPLRMGDGSVSGVSPHQGLGTAAAVIAAILPMAFVRGLMGPYMRPIPIGASTAMFFSMGVAFVVPPWAAYRLLRAEAAPEPHQGHLGLMAGEVASTLLSRLAVPVLYYISEGGWKFASKDQRQHEAIPQEQHGHGNDRD
jgi:multidrug efflux pump subunit AcrB